MTALTTPKVPLSLQSDTALEQRISELRRPMNHQLENLQLTKKLSALEAVVRREQPEMNPVIDSTRVESLQQALEDRSKELIDLMVALKKSEQKYTTSEEELQRLRDDLSRTEEENEENIKRVMRLQGTLEHVTSVVEQKSAEFRSLNDENENLRTVNKALVLKLNAVEKNLVSMTAQAHEAEKFTNELRFNESLMADEVKNLQISVQSLQAQIDQGNNESVKEILFFQGQLENEVKAKVELQAEVKKLRDALAVRAHLEAVHLAEIDSIKIDLQKTSLSKREMERERNDALLTASLFSPAETYHKSPAVVPETYAPNDVNDDISEIEKNALKALEAYASLSTK